MQAISVYRLADGPAAARLYLDGHRVSLSAWEAAHSGKRTECYASHMQTRRDGSVIVREYHNIRSK